MKTNKKNKMNVRNKLYGLLLTTCFLFAGCCDDPTASMNSGIKILRSELNFHAAASKGYTLVSDAHCTATTQASWCRVEQKADSIFVYVEDNIGMEGRNATLSITDQHGNIQHVPIHQQGGFFRLEQERILHLGDSCCSTTIALASSFDYETMSNTEWLSLSEEGTNKTLELHVEKNVTGQPRHSIIDFYCPTLNKTLSIDIYQYSVDDLMGTWTASYTHNDGISIEKSVELVRHGKNDIRLNGLRDGVSLKAQIQGMTFAFPTHINLGKYNGRYDMYQFGVDENHEAYSREKENKTIRYAATLSVEEDNFKCIFEGDSTFSNGKLIKGLIVSGYSEGSTSARVIEEYYQLTLSRPNIH